MTRCDGPGCEVCARRLRVSVAQRGTMVSFKSALDNLLGTGGTFSARSEGATEAARNLERRMQAIEDRLADKEQALYRKFSALEAAMAKSQSQTSAVMAQISRMNATSSPRSRRKRGCCRVRDRARLAHARLGRGAPHPRRGRRVRPPPLHAALRRRRLRLRARPHPSRERRVWEGGAAVLRGAARALRRPGAGRLWNGGASYARRSARSSDGS